MFLAHQCGFGKGKSRTTQNFGCNSPTTTCSNYQDNYGRKDGNCEKKVKEVFNELKLDQDYYEYEEKVVTELKKKIAAVDESRGFKAEVLTTFLNKIYKRSK